mgnify:CR=1 FL=1
MKKFAFAVLTLSVLAASTGAVAEEEAAKAVKGGSGQISFTGVINNDACSVDGASGNDKMIAVDMGSVSIKDMGTDSAPGAGRVAANDFNLKVNCNAGTKVAMIFQPTKGAGSGIVTGTKVLKLTDGLGAAKTADALRYKSPIEVEALRAVRAALDPKRIMNPRVLF